LTIKQQQQQQKPHLGIPEETLGDEGKEFLLSAIGSAKQSTVR